LNRDFTEKICVYLNFWEGALMIYIFRKEMKKWHTVLWVVLASLLIGGSTTIFWRKRHPSEAKVASVNGMEINFKQYNQVLNELKSQIEVYKNYARAYGISMDFFLNLAGLQNPEKAALDRCINNRLIDQQKDYFKIEIDSESFGDQLLKRLPAQLKDPSGNLNMEAYRFFLSRNYTTIKEFEAGKENDLKRELFDNFIEKSNYVPSRDVLQNFVSDSGKKNFYVLVFPFDKFLNEEKKNQPTKAVLEEFYKKNKENYLIPEKRQARFWIISPEQYAQKIEIDDQAIQNFYDKNKSSLFRIPPKIKVKRILFKVSKDSTPQVVEKILDKAKDIHTQLVKSSEKFDDMVKKYSEDLATKAKGGVIDFFERGTHDADFEKAAFRLSNSGDISDVVKTKNGFEIIQLVGRMPASEKPLEKVKNDIIKAITVKREQTVLRADLERTLHEAKNDEMAISKFAQANHLTEQQTDFLSSEDSAGKEIKNMLAEKIFSIKRQKGVYGYFVHDKEYILYQLSGLKDSFIPSFEKIEKNVLDDYQNDMAKNLLKNTVKKSQKDILSKKTSLKNLSETLGLKLLETGIVKKGEEVKINGLNKEFTDRAFILNDTTQVLSFKNNSNYYLVQLIQADQPDMQKFQNEKNKVAKELQEKENRLYLSAFIASLLRNAKIEKVQEIFESKHKHSES
jgi:peptidyl-prolyl cis-trans isomerase D